MSVRVFVASNLDQKRDYAKQALEHKLYNPGWMLSSELDEIENGRYDEIVDISLAFEDQTPIGVAIYFTPINRSSVRVGSVFPPRSVICFVASNKRRKGVGQKLIESFNVPHSEMKCWKGEEHSSKFWTKIGTNYRGLWDWSDAA